MLLNIMSAKSFIVLPKRGSTSKRPRLPGSPEVIWPLDALRKVASAVWTVFSSPTLAFMSIGDQKWSIVAAGFGQS